MKLWHPRSSSLAPRGPLLVGRELGLKNSIGQDDALSRDLYKKYLASNSWDFGRDSSFGYHGGIFNLEFSPDGKILVAACEQKSFITFDPLTHKPIHCVENAHSDCVNCVRFLDSRTFATCSDDTTIGLWDVRNLRQRITSLKGHSNWVKNIEYAQDEGLLVTSGFDGSVYAWNINNCTEEGASHSRIFHSNGLMRMRLTPDASKMVLCTTNGYLMIVHDLDLNHLAQDLAGFKPNMYRLMQLTRTPFPIAVASSDLFSARRNRVELVSDFPVGNDAEVISSLQIHPYGWCALSRNTSSDDQSEWTCVHDIQDLSPPSRSGKRPRGQDEDEEADRSKRSSTTRLEASAAPEPVLRSGSELGNSRSLIDSSLSDSDEDSNDEYEYENETPSPVSPETVRNDGESAGEVGRRRLSADSVANRAPESPDVPPSLVATVGSNDSLDNFLNSPGPSFGRRTSEGQVSNIPSPDYGASPTPDNRTDNSAETPTAVPAYVLHEYSNVGVSRSNEDPQSVDSSPQHSPGYSPMSPDSSPELGTAERSRRYNSPNYGAGASRAVDTQEPRSSQDPLADLDPAPSASQARVTYRVEEPRRGNLATRGVQVRIRAPLAWGEGSDGRSSFQLRNANDPEPTQEIEVRLPSLEILEALQAIRARRGRNNDPASVRVRIQRRPNQRQVESVDISGASASATFVQAASNFAARTVVYQSDLRVRQLVSDLTSARRPRSGERTASYSIHENVPRLTHFREEPNMGRGFIKELCFSTDGRVIASPFGYGVRLLAFNNECSEMSHCMEGWDNTPVKLYELSTSICHTNVVVSTKFSPTHCMLVSGCLNGKVVWHQPVL